MTNKELSKLYKLRKEISRLEDEIELLEDPSLVQQLTGMPFGGGATDKVANSAIRLASLRLKLEAARLDAMQELETLTDYIQGIDDPVIKTIMQARHIEGLPWEKVADKVGGGNTGETVRVKHWRFLNNE